MQRDPRRDTKKLKGCQRSKKGYQQYRRDFKGKRERKGFKGFGISCMVFGMFALVVVLV